MQKIPPSQVQPSAYELLERENASFHESLKGLSRQMALELYRRKIEELELKLREEKLEYENAKARDEFFDQAESDVYLGKLELTIDKLRVEQSSIGSHKPIPAPSVSLAPTVPSAVVAPRRSKPSFSTAKAVDRKKLTVKQAADYLGVAVQTVYQWCSEKRILYYKIGSKTFFDADDLDALRAKNKVKPISEVVRAKGKKDIKSVEKNHLASRDD